MIFKRYWIIIFLIALIGTIILGIHRKNNYQTMIGTILEIQDDKIILVEDYLDKEYYYHLKYEDIKGKDKNHIKVGDIIEIKCPEEEYEKKVSTYANNLINIKSFKIIGQNLEKIENTHYYNSIDNISLIVNEFTTQGISFTITDTNKNPYQYLDEYKIYKYNDKEVSKKNKKISEKTVVQSNKFNESMIFKTYDWTDMYGKLEKRKIYI